MRARTHPDVLAQRGGKPIGSGWRHPLLLLLSVPLCITMAGSARAQQPVTDSASARRGPVPRAVAREALEVFNAPGTIRSLGPYMLDSGTTANADVAVVGGPVVIAGHVTGKLVAMNATVRLTSSAVVNGGLLAVGGSVAAEEGARVDGDVRIYRDSMAYVERGDLLVLTDSTGGVSASLEELWANWRARDRRSGVRFTVTSTGSYNRVEGLPILAGPEFRGPRRWGETKVSVLGVFRTADEFRWDSDNLGHDVRGSVTLGRERGVTISAGLYDLVRPVEEWQLDADESGLASFLFRRDFRDYFGVHGGRLGASAFLGPDADLTLSYADERWASRDARDPLSIFRNGGTWRPNPGADAGSFHVATAALRLDTRNVIDSPWSGWYAQFDYERGSGRVGEFAVLSPGVRPTDDPEVVYGRGFIDLRRYNRLAPGAQLNVRAVAGGWLHGDPLPAQRRLSVGGPGSLPGYDFRGLAGPSDLGQCSMDVVPAGKPAQCDRIALLQVEYRGDLHLHDFGAVGDMVGRGWRHSAQWVAFANSGRGWLVRRDGGTVQPDDSGLWLGSRSFPALDSFRTDLGVGVDLGLIGIYVSRGITDPGQRTNVFIRLHERF